MTLAVTRYFSSTDISLQYRYRYITERFSLHNHLSVNDRKPDFGIESCKKKGNNERIAYSRKTRRCLFFSESDFKSIYISVFRNNSDMNMKFLIITIDDTFKENLSFYPINIQLQSLTSI